MSGKIKAVGFDLDDVLLNFNDALFPYHNSLYGTNYERKDIKTFDLGAIWNNSREEVEKKIIEFCASDAHKNAKPVAGSVEVIKRLKENHNLYIVTARPEELKKETLEWLDKNFPNTFKEVHFTNHFQGKNNKKAKSEVCRELGVQIFVDDSLKNVYDIVRAHIEVLLFDAPWNAGRPWLPVTRVRSWQDIEHHINLRNLGK